MIFTGLIARVGAAAAHHGEGAPRREQDEAQPDRPGLDADDRFLPLPDLKMADAAALLPYGRNRASRVVHTRERKAPLLSRLSRRPQAWPVERVSAHQARAGEARL